jgi:nucleoside diphosphate kinase
MGFTLDTPEGKGYFGYSSTIKLPDESSLTFVKLDFFRKYKKVFDYFNQQLQLQGDFWCSQIFNIPPTRERLESLYPHVKKNFPQIFEKMCDNWISLHKECGLNCAVRIYHGKNIISRGKIITGCTDPSKADEGTIRKVFSDDSLEKARMVSRAVRNVFHCSGSSEESKNEKEILLGNIYNFRWTYFPMNKE